MNQHRTSLSSRRMALSAFRTSCSSRAPKSAPAASEVSGYETIWRADISDCSVWSDTLRSKLVVFTGEHIHLLERHRRRHPLAICPEAEPSVLPLSSVGGCRVTYPALRERVQIRAPCGRLDRRDANRLDGLVERLARLRVPVVNEVSARGHKADICHGHVASPSCPKTQTNFRPARWDVSD